MKTLIVLLSFGLVARGQTGNPRAKALSDALARGDKALAAGQRKQASAAWNLLLLFEPNHVEAKKRIDSVPTEPRGDILPAEFDVMRSAVLRGIQSPEDLCGFPTTRSDFDLVNLRMISDSRLLPNLETSPGPIQSEQCANSNSDVFVFLARPDLSMAEVRRAYGKPQAEKKDTDGSEVLTYARFRVFGGTAGKAAYVLLQASKR